ncbi:MAG: hypothetical protein FD167_5135, partial [bacterium]
MLGLGENILSPKSRKEIMSKLYQTFLYQALEDGVYYPESDGKPMAENTTQYKWIVTIKEGLEVELPND